MLRRNPVLSTLQHFKCHIAAKQRTPGAHPSARTAHVLEDFWPWLFNRLLYLLRKNCTQTLSFITFTHLLWSFPTVGLKGHVLLYDYSSMRYVVGATIEFCFLNHIKKMFSKLFSHFLEVGHKSRGRRAGGADVAASHTKSVSRPRLRLMLWLGSSSLPRDSRAWTPGSFHPVALSGSISGTWSHDPDPGWCTSILLIFRRPDRGLPPCRRGLETRVSCVPVWGETCCNFCLLWP